MRILGLDPGTGRLGFAVIEVGGNRSACLACGCFETEKTLLPGARLAQLRNAVEDIIERFQPGQAVLEKLFFSKNVRTAMAVAEARGMLLTLLTDAKVPILEVSPQEVKSGVTGVGNASKPQVQKMVKMIFGLTKLPKSDDAADALAIAYAGTARIVSLRR